VCANECGKKDLAKGKEKGAKGAKTSHAQLNNYPYLSFLKPFHEMHNKKTNTNNEYDYD
jgi:hypothetical protein